MKHALTHLLDEFELAVREHQAETMWRYQREYAKVVAKKRKAVLDAHDRLVAALRDLTTLADDLRVMLPASTDDPSAWPSITVAKKLLAELGEAPNA